MLRHRTFRVVWIGAMGSSIGSWMESTGVRWIVGLSGSALTLSLLAAAQMVPMLLLGLAGGVVADRVNRKTLLIVTQAIMMVIAAGMALASYLFAGLPTRQKDLTNVLLILSLAQGTTMAFNVPAWQVLTPRLVPREELSSAIALNGLQFNLARVIGPALGGWFLAGLNISGTILWSSSHGATVLFLINTASFIGVLWAVWLTPDAPAPQRDGVSAAGQTAEAVSWMFRNRGPRAVFLAIVIFAALGGPMLTMLPLFITGVYHKLSDTYGTLLAMMGAGAVAGVFVLRIVPGWYPRHHSIPASVLGAGAAITLFAGTESFVMGGLWLFFIGLFWLLVFNQAFSAIQLLVDDRMRGRAMAVCNTAAFGATPLGALIAGGISELASGSPDDGPGVQVAIGAMGITLGLAGLAMLIWRTPEIDGLRPGEPGHAPRRSLLHGFTASAHRPRAENAPPPVNPPAA
ncbi:MAG: MFS transporter [Phycisphaeraceae bacterium]|nr:MFS transporter [Phycisphaeraceae bacterium]